MTSYEIGSNSSRYPYDYSFVTDGTNSEYTDTTESNFILPIITGADADKFLQVNAQATGYEYTAIDGELPPQAGQTGNFLQTNGNVVSWQLVNQVPGATAGNSGQYLTNDGSTTSWGSVRQVPTIIPGASGNSGYILTNDGTNAVWTNGPIGLTTGGTAQPMLWFGASNNGFAEAWTAGGGATGVSAITNGVICCTFQSGAIRLPGGNPIRSNGNAASRFQFTIDVPNMQNSVTTGTVGTDRIVNVSSANWASTSLDLVCSNTNDTPGALNASSMGIEIKQNQIVFNGAGTTASATLPPRVTRMTIDNTQISVSLPLVVSNYISASSIIISTTGFVMNQSGSTTAQAYTFRNFDTTDSNRNNTNRQGIYSPAVGAIAISTNSISAGTTAGSTAGRPDAIERFRVDDNYVTVTNSLNLSRTNPAPSATAPHLFFGDITAPVSGVWGTNDNLFFGTNGTQRANISNTGMSITGDLTVSGTISGSISTPQVAKRTFVIGATSSAAYVYDSGNTAPATTLISNSIQATKNITLGNMGASYDGFEFEFLLTGDLNNFGVAVTLSLAGSFVKVRSGAIGIDGSTAGQVFTFSRPMNEFRITGVFVWNGGTNPYWVVIDRGVYKQRATNDIHAGSTAAYEVTRNTPEDLMYTRDNNTTIDFKNLVTQGGSQEDYAGFNFWLSPSANITGSVSFKNSLSVAISVITSGGVTTINANTTSLIHAANAAGSLYRCVFRNQSGFKWFIYGV